MIEKINKCLAFEIFDVYIFMKINNFFRKFILKSRNHAKTENKNLARAQNKKKHCEIKVFFPPNCLELSKFFLSIIDKHLASDEIENKR